MSTKTGFIIIVLSILLVPLLMVSIILPSVFQTERASTRFPQISTKEDLQKFIEIESEQKYPIDDTENFLFITLNEGKITASNIEGFSSGTLIDADQLLDFLSETASKDSIQLIRHIPDIADALLISLPFTAESFFSQGRYILKVFPALILFSIICIVTVISLLILRNMSRKFRQLETAAEEISGGNLDYRIEIAGKDDFSSFAEKFDKMRITLKEEKERESRFIMGISHDLKTPLALIGGYTEALIDDVGSSSEERENYGLIINRKLRDLEKKIDTLIDYRHMETGEWKTSLNRIKLRTLLEEMCPVWKEDADFSKINFKSDINITDDYETSIDPDLFSRAIENIINNSLKYTPEGGSVNFSAYLQDGSGKIEITDSGSGIEKDELKKVLEPFYRVSKSRREPGFGLGLSIVKSIADNHGWNISIESEPGFGTKVIIAGI